MTSSVTIVELCTPRMVMSNGDLVGFPWLFVWVGWKVNLVAFLWLAWAERFSLACWTQHDFVGWSIIFAVDSRDMYEFSAL